MNAEKIKLLEGLLSIAVENATEDLNAGVYKVKDTSAAFALIIEGEFLDLVEMSGQFNMENDEQYMFVKVFFEDNLEEAMLGE